MHKLNNGCNVPKREEKKTKQKRNGQRGHGAINMIASKSASKEL